MTRLSARLEALTPRVTLLLPVAARRTLVRVADGRSIERAGHVIGFDESGTARLSFGMRDRPLAEQLAFERRLHPDRDDWPVYLAPRRETSASAVAEAAALVAASGLEVRLLVAGPERPRVASDRRLLRVPAVAELRDELEGTGDSQRSTLIAKAMSRAIMPCAQIIEVFGRVAGDSAMKKYEILVGAGDAARECNCQMRDVDVFEYAMLATFDAYEPPIGWIPLPSSVQTHDDRRMGAVVVEVNQ